nr:LysR substrate-binding domain-containing protein [Gluconacetobacter tumulisoli]
MLKAFEAFGRTGSVRGAAQLLGVSPVIIRRHLRGLEEWMGVGLINRDAGELTPRGQSYHARIAGSLLEIARASEDARVTTDGGLRIRCVPGFACNWLVYRLDAFRHSYREIELQIRPDRTPSNFEQDDFHADIRYLGPEDLDVLPPTLRAVEICRPPIFPVASPSLARDINSRIRGPRDLLDERLITTDFDRGWMAWFQAQSVPVAAIRPFARMWHISLALAAAKDSQGVAIIDSYLGDQDLLNGTIERIGVPGMPWHEARRGTYAIVAPHANWHNGMLTRFCAWLLDSASTFQPVMRAEISPGR